MLCDALSWFKQSLFAKRDTITKTNSMLSTTSKAYKGTLTNDLHSKWLQVTRIVVMDGWFS